MRVLRTLFIAAAMVFSLGAGASEKKTASSTVVVPEKKLSMFTEVSLLSSLQPWNSLDHDNVLDLIFAPAYLLAPKVSLSGKFIFEQDLRGEQLNKIAKSNVGVNHSGVDLNQSLHLSGGVAALLPIDHGKRLNDSMLFGFSAGPMLTLDFSKLRAPGLKIIYGLSGARFFHDYNTKANGKPNVQYSMANLLNLAYSFSDRWALSSSAVINTGWTYASALLSDFDFMEEVDCQITPSVGLVVGIDNSGNTLKPDGYSSNISVFNNSSAAIYGGVTYSF